MKEKMGSREWIYLLILSVLWGGSFFFYEVALTALPLFTIVFLRVFLGAAILLVIITLRGRRLPAGAKVWAALLVMGLINNVIPFSLIVWGQKSITGGVASLMNSATPFFAILAAHFLTHDEKITPRKLIGVGVGFFGVFTLIGFEAVGGENSAAGMLAVVAATISYAFSGIWGRRFKVLGVDPMAAAAGQLISASVILLPIVFIVDRPWEIPLPGASVWAALLGIGLLSTALAFTLYFRILATSGATNVLLVTFLIPVSAILLGGLFLNETVGLRHFLGMGIIGLGLMVIDGRTLDRILLIRRRSSR